MMDQILKDIRQTRGMLTSIADGVNIRLAAVSTWRRVPAERVLDVERITGISRTELRPDIYPKELKA
jgi:DNA-binding transcriptional regulator YdaS (Cro superfamily)